MSATDLRSSADIALAARPALKRAWLLKTSMTLIFPITSTSASSWASSRRIWGIRIRAWLSASDLLTVIAGQVEVLLHGVVHSAVLSQFHFPLLPLREGPDLGADAVLAGDVELGHVLCIHKLLEGRGELKASLIIDLRWMVSAKLHCGCPFTGSGWFECFRSQSVHLSLAVGPVGQDGSLEVANN